MAERLLPPLYEKGNLQISKRYRGITLNATTAEIYNALFLNCIQTEVEKILKKINIVFGEIDPQFQFVESSKKYAKNLERTILFVDFFWVYGFI